MDVLFLRFRLSILRSVVYAFIIHYRSSLRCRIPEFMHEVSTQDAVESLVHVLRLMKADYRKVPPGGTSISLVSIM